MNGDGTCAGDVANVQSPQVSLHSRVSGMNTFGENVTRFPNARKRSCAAARRRSGSQPQVASRVHRPSAFVAGPGAFGETIGQQIPCHAKIVVKVIETPDPAERVTQDQDGPAIAVVRLMECSPPGQHSDLSTELQLTQSRKATHTANRSPNASTRAKASSQVKLSSPVEAAVSTSSHVTGVDTVGSLRARSE